MAPFFVRLFFDSSIFFLQVLASVGQPESANFVRVRVRAARTANSVDLGIRKPQPRVRAQSAVSDIFNRFVRSAALGL